jgi:hypothetical protein
MAELRGRIFRSDHKSSVEQYDFYYDMSRIYGNFHCNNDTALDSFPASTYSVFESLDSTEGESLL